MYQALIDCTIGFTVTATALTALYMVVTAYAAIIEDQTKG